MPDDQNMKDKILQLVESIVKQDQALRQQYQVGDKFRFIRDRLQAILSYAQENLTKLQKNVDIKTTKLNEDETVVYVYLFNAQGLMLPSWKKMLNPSVFYEHSVNRPVYTELAQIEAFLRSKTNKAQHGYLAIAVKKEDIIRTDTSLKDVIGNLLIKVREGSLHFDKVIHFTHQDRHYRLDEKGEIIEKKGN